MKHLSAIATLLLLCSSAGFGESTKPNIVLILVDDLDDSISPYLDAMPALKSLVVEKGMRFTQSYAPSSLCCPARATMLTGLYAHNSGVWNVTGALGGFKAFVDPRFPDGKPMPVDNEQRSFGPLLKQAGYRTALLGKYFNGTPDEYVAPGWNEWAGGHNDFYVGYGYTLTEFRDDIDAAGTFRRVKYGYGEKDYSTDVLRGKAVDFIGRAESKDDEPFFLFVAPTAPHSPLPPARRHTEIAKKWTHAANQPYRARPNYLESDLSDKSPQIQQLARMYRASGVLDQIDANFAQRMGTLYAVDDLVRDIVEALKTNGELENTYIFFTSDNGYELGANSLVFKGLPYQESIRVPLFVRGPNVPVRVSDSLVTQCDYAPTFLEIAGEEIPSYVDGRSLVSHISKHRRPAWQRNDILLRISPSTYAFESDAPPEASVQAAIRAGVLTSDWMRTAKEPTGGFPGFRAIVTKQQLFIEFDEFNQSSKAEEFYVLRSDPFQLRNVLADRLEAAKHATTLEKLRKRLEVLSTCSGSSCW